jgi:hypothetical protein
MADVEHITSDSEQFAPSSRWHGTVTWTSLLLAALVLYEATNQPAVGVATFCSKFGWTDFRTAQWLYRYDPRKERGRACWWLYVAWGLWKIGVVAFLADLAIVGAIVLFAIFFVRNQPGGALPVRLIQLMTGAGVTLLAGLGLSSLATVWAVVIGVRHRLVLWLSGTVRRARQARIWPPYDDSRNSSANRIGALQITGFLSLLLIVTPLCVVLLFSALIAVRFRWLPEAVVAVVGIGIWPAAWLWTRACHAVTAACPEDCWPPDELAAESADPLQ